MPVVSTIHQLQIRHQACVKQKCFQIHIYYLFHFNIKFWPVEENVKLAVKSNNCTNNVKTVERECEWCLSLVITEKMDFAGWSTETADSTALISQDRLVSTWRWTCHTSYLA